MEIIKLVNEYGFADKKYDIELIEDDKKMIICQQGQDPHIEFRYTDFREIHFPVSMDIYPDLTEFYTLTDNLYNNVRSGNLFWAKPESNIFNQYKGEALDSPLYNLVCRENMVVYEDDASPSCAPDVLRLINKGDHYTFEFDRLGDIQECRGVPFTKDEWNVSICIRRSGSRQTPFNIPFNWFYTNLQEIEEIKNKPKKRELTI